MADTEAAAADLARRLTPGDVVALHGPMGAGKTQFVRGLVRALGGDSRQVSSPTYVLLHMYNDCTPPVFHLDAYRVSGPDDFDAIGFEELLTEPAITVVEWPTRVAPLLPPDCWQVTIEPVDETTRQLTVTRP